MRLKSVWNFTGKAIPAICFLLVLGLHSPALSETGQKTHPVNCATAEGDLRALNAEKEHAEQQQLLDVTAITPAGALLGLIKGDEQQKLQMLSGDYVKSLDARIAETKEQCGIS